MYRRGSLLYPIFGKSPNDFGRYAREPPKETDKPLVDHEEEPTCWGGLGVGFRVKG